MLLEMVVLAIEAVEGARMVEDGQVLVPELRPSGDSIAWITAAGAGGTDKRAHAVGRERVVVVGEVALVRAPACDRPPHVPAKTAKSRLTFRDLAAVHAERARTAVFPPGRLGWQSVGPPAPVVYLLDFGPYLGKVGPNTVSAIADHLRDGSPLPVAVSTGPHGARPNLPCSGSRKASSAGRRRALVNNLAVQRRS